METYNVKQVAEMLNTNPETVRRWIRSGKLNAIQESRKEGNVVTQQMLNAFIKSTPKYARFAMSAAGVSAGIITAAAALLGGLAVQQYGKSKTVENARVSPEEIEKLLKKNIATRNEAIERKTQIVEQLQQEIGAERQNIKASRELINKLHRSSSSDKGEKENEGKIAEY